MVARRKKAVAPGRDNPLLEKLELVAQQTGCVGFVVNSAGLAAIRHELDPKGHLFGFAIFCVLPQKERVRAYWDTRDLDAYLAKHKLRK